VCADLRPLDHKMTIPVLRPLAPRHAEAAARLHILGQPGTFLTSLGHEVLTEIYRALPKCAAGLGFAVEDARQPERLLGFVGAAVSVGRLFVEVGTQRLPALAPALLRRYAQSPALVVRSAQTVLYPLMASDSSQSDSQGVQDAPAELLSIMVEPDLRGRGLGALLVATLVDACQARAIVHLDVTVDAANDGAQRFYARHSFSRHHTITLYGRPMVVLRRRLFAAADAGAVAPTQDAAS
jgi:ribosomal protein S18 acetylase RimI-like enzyme